MSYKHDQIHTDTPDTGRQTGGESGGKSRTKLGNSLLILTAFIWGTAFVGQRAGMESVGPVTFNAARMALAAITIGITAFCLRRRDRQALEGRTDAGIREYRRNTIVGGICCGTFLGCAAFFQQIGIVHTTAGKAGFITAMYILLVPVIGFIVFRKKTSWLGWTAVLIGVVGMYLLCAKEGLSLSRGDALVAVCALFFSGHILCCDYFVQRGNAVRISAIQFLTACVLSTPAALIMENPTWGQIRAAAIPILWLGVLSGGIGYTLQIVAQQWTNPTVASLLMSLESVFAVIAGTVVLHEHMSSRELAGCAVMFAAIILVQIPLPEKR